VREREHQGRGDRALPGRRAATVADALTAPSIESPVNFVLSALTEPVPVVEAVPRTEITSAWSRLMLLKVPSARVMRVVEGSL